MKRIAASLVILLSALGVSAQETVQGPGALNERRVALNEVAVALDASGAPALEATLRTTALNGAPEAPVTNVRIVVKNPGVTWRMFVARRSSASTGRPSISKDDCMFSAAPKEACVEPADTTPGSVESSSSNRPT